MKRETSVMSVVFCQDKILVTHEMIYGELKISLPKGHVESGESFIETAIREVFEETDIIISSKDFVSYLQTYDIHFKNHLDEEIHKEIIPILFIQ